MYCPVALYHCGYVYEIFFEANQISHGALVLSKSKRNEGKLSQVQLSKVNERLERFKQCKLYEFDAHVGPLYTSTNYKFHVLRQFFYYHFFPAFRGILLQSDLQHVMLLQHAMLLLGGFCPDKVSEANIREATAVLKEYNRILIAKGRVDLQTIR